ncbi:ABC transporter substrate-binding protein [Thalassomonas haliotis]|uniref:Uncharacterized protein n=1 Tax=Thalassomonas haliotis TaxID=485448 RepID=A0ABY7VCI8_9GAMM|nr:ABC transporter substrate binding protein [Thalassomonas haliotis]WDE10839.1 hypothetical protein H3N35_21720 [Thalassomonas haliotis]
MSSRVNNVFKICFFIGLVLYLIWETIQRPRVLVVQSYTNEFSWTEDIDHAIRQVLSKQLYDVRYYYMDTKNHSDNKFKKIAGSLVRKQIDDWSPNVLIAVDDNAQSLVSSCYVDSKKLDLTGEELALLKADFPDFGDCFDNHSEMMVIYAGVGAEPKDYGFTGQEHIGGITERMDIPALTDTLEMVKSGLDKSSLKIIAPVDNSTTSHYNIKNAFRSLSETLAPLDISLEHKVAVTAEDWQRNILQANEQGDLLLFTLYHTVRCEANDEAKRISPRDLIQWTMANSQIPSIGAWGFFVEDGGLLSIGVSPFEQGTVAANMAVDYLERGILPGQQDVKTTQQSIIYMREHRAKKQGFDLPIIYRNFSRATENYISECDAAQNECTADVNRVPDLKRYCQG